MKEKDFKKSNARIIIDFRLNVTRLQDGKTVVNNHMDGKLTMEIDKVREIVRTAVASALKGAADSLEEDGDKVLNHGFDPVVDD